MNESSSVSTPSQKPQTKKTQQQQNALATTTEQITKSLARKLNTQVSRVRETKKLPEDVLQSQDVFLKLRCHVGFPEDVDSVAYQSSRKLLAVGTRHGRVKVIGSDGVECLLSVGSVDSMTDVVESDTVFLGFVKKSGILHVSRCGLVQLFSLVDGARVDALTVGGGVRDVAVVPGGPYMLVGFDNGDCRIIQIGSSGKVENKYAAAQSVVVKPYRIFAEDLEVKGDLVCVESIMVGDGRPCILFVYSYSGAVVYDVRAEKVLACTPDGAEGKVPTCACWVGDAGNCFAIGYEDGSIRVWGIPASTLRVHPSKVVRREDAVTILDLCVHRNSGGGGFSPIQSVTCVQGGVGTPYSNDCLLVLGGQDVGEPNMLSLVSLEPQEHADDVVMIPWFGEIISHTLMSSPDGDRVMILTQGGQLVVHDIATWEPLPVSLKFQELSPISSTSFMASVGHVDSHSPCLKNVRYLSWKHVEDSKWPFNGGIPPKNYFISESEYMQSDEKGSQKFVTHPSGMVLMGHRDGRLRVWDATSEVPKHLTTVPSSLEVISGEGRIMPVTCFDACPISGVLAVGHAGGVVRVYQFSTSPQSVRKVFLGDSMPYDSQSDQAPGWQYILHYSFHTENISSVCLATREGLLAVGDESGCVTVVNLNEPERMAEYRMPIAIHSIKISNGLNSVGSPKKVVSGMHCSVFCLGRDGSMNLFDSRTGKPALSKPLKPKNTTSPLCMVLLDSEGSVLAPLSGELELAWADNNAISRPRTFGMTKVAAMSQGRQLGATARDFDASEAMREDEAMMSGKYSDFDDINTDADLWSTAPSVNVCQEDTYPNDSFYSSYLKKNSKKSCDMIVLASSDCLRLYSVDSMVKGDRGSEKKVKLDETAIFCGHFHSVSGSGIITVSTSVSCYSLPGLEKLGETDENCFFLEPQGLNPWAVSTDGQLLVTSRTNELMRFSSLVRSPCPIGPQSLVPKDALLPRSTSNHSDDVGSSSRNNNVAIQGITNILGTVKVAATAASGAMISEIEKISGQKDLPTLGEVFQKEVTALDEEIAYISEEEEDHSPSRVTPVPQTTAQRRSELLGPRPKSGIKSGSGKPVKRTASAVKREYGATSKANDVRSIMENNRNMLAERGIKLSNLEQKSEALQNDAEDFASMAQELEKAFAERKWYHF